MDPASRNLLLRLECFVPNNQVASRLLSANGVSSVVILLTIPALDMSLVHIVIEAGNH